MGLIILELQEAPKKELILICYDCHRMFQKTFFFRWKFLSWGKKKCLIESYPKKCEQKVEIAGICHQKTKHW